jgi:hypothetical protein
MRVAEIAPAFVTSFPETLEPGLLYVSDRFATAAHLCACGCQRKVVTPLSRAQWVLTFDGTVSLWPSVGNWALPCESHYVIERGTIRWAEGFSDDRVRRNRDADARAIEQARRAERPSRWRRLVGWLTPWRIKG